VVHHILLGRRPLRANSIQTVPRAAQDIESRRTLVMDGGVARARARVPKLLVQGWARSASLNTTLSFRYPREFDQSRRIFKLRAHSRCELPLSSGAGKGAILSRDERESILATPRLTSNARFLS